MRRNEGRGLLQEGEIRGNKGRVDVETEEKLREVWGYGKRINDGKEGEEMYGKLGGI